MPVADSGLAAVLSRLLETLAGRGRLSMTQALELAGSRVALDRLRAWTSPMGLPVVWSSDGLAWRSLSMPLSAARVAGFMAGPERPENACPVEVRMLVDSTNLRLLDRARDGAIGPLALVADCQSDGRGRLQRRWLSRYGESVALSLLTRIDRPPAELPGLSIVVGVAVARALIDLGVPEVGLKWPNDIWRRSGKLGGILVEAVASGRSADAAPGATVVVIGIGLNWRMPTDPDGVITQPAAALEPALASAGTQVDRDQVAGAVLARLCRAVEVFGAEGLPGFLPSYAQLDVLAGREVIVDVGGERRIGHALGLAVDGALRVAHDSGEQRYRSADVSVRSL